MIVVSHSEQDTQAAAQEFAREMKAGDLIYLHGDLGAGKSVFARAMIRSLCGDALLEVPSPTFTLVQVYETRGAPVYHFDLYRIEEAEEIFELGWEEALGEGITLVEWPSRLGPYKRAPSYDVTITPAQGNSETREIKIERCEA